MTYVLGHSGAETETFRLEPIDSAKGWFYGWYDLENKPIHRLDAPAANIADENVKIVGTGIPTCTRAMDTIHITATSVTTPSIRAVATGKVTVSPHPEICTSADLVVDKVARRSFINAGEAITYTVSITNHGFTAPVTATLVDTWMPVAAVVGVDAPGCQVDLPAGVITCTQAELGLGSVHLPDPYLVLTTSATYSGTLTNMAVVTPTGSVTDPEPGNNSSAPVEVAVRTEEERYSIYLPLVLRSH
jgi:hypothetical protein